MLLKNDHSTWILTLFQATKAHKKLGWEPKISFQELVKEMVEEDYKISKRNELIRNNGYEILDYYEWKKIL